MNLTIEEKLEFRNRQIAYLLSKENARAALEKMTRDEQELNSFALSLAKKHDVDTSQYVFNTETLTFQKHETS